VIARISCGQSLNPRLDTRSANDVLQAVDPLYEFERALRFHASM